MKLTEHYTLTLPSAIFWLFLILTIPVLINLAVWMRENRKKRLKSYKRVEAAWMAVQKLDREVDRGIRRQANDEFYRLLSEHIGLWPNDMSGNLKRYRAIYNEHINDW